MRKAIANHTFYARSNAKSWELKLRLASSKVLCPRPASSQVEVPERSLAYAPHPWGHASTLETQANWPKA